MYNTNMIAAEITAGFTEGVQRARKPDAETTIETNLRNNRGTTVVRVNPTPTVTPMEVKIKEVDAAVVFKTQAV